MKHKQNSKKTFSTWNNFSVTLHTDESHHANWAWEKSFNIRLHPSSWKQVLNVNKLNIFVIYVDIYTYTHICICIFVYVSIYIHIYIYMCIYMYMHMYIYIYTYNMYIYVLFVVWWLCVWMHINDSLFQKDTWPFAAPCCNYMIGRVLQKSFHERDTMHSGTLELMTKTDCVCRPYCLA